MPTITGYPRLTASPGDGFILWQWEPPETDGTLVYGIDIAALPGAPDAAPTNDGITAHQFLSTSLTNGLAYCARVQAFLTGGTPGVPPSISNLACSTPGVYAADLSRVRYRID